MSDAAILDRLVDRLGSLPGVEAVTLGGSRATGTAGPDADWDLGLYDRGTLDPDDLRALGWPGRVFDRGAWGGGVFDGGAWLEVEGRRVDVHYRDLRVVEHELAEARAGRVRWEPGIPATRVTNEKRLLDDAGLPGWTTSLADAGTDADGLLELLDHRAVLLAPAEAGGA